MTGAADHDPSGIGTYSQVGAAFGFGLLWMSVVTLPLAAAVQELAARLGLATAAQAATALGPVAGRFASLLFALGIIGTGMLAVPVLAGSTAYALAEAVGWNAGLSTSFGQARGFYSVIVGAMGGGPRDRLRGRDPVHGLCLAAILNGVAAPPLILLMLLLGNDRGTMGRWRSSRLSNEIVGRALLTMVLAPIAYLLS